MPPPASQESPSKSSLLLALVCASIVADYDRLWLARPVAQLIPEGGPRPEWVSRIKAKLRDVFADLVAAATGASINHSARELGNVGTVVGSVGLAALALK